jgi:RNA polymerase sigma-70 factor (TIGR02943 family)
METNNLLNPQRWVEAHADYLFSFARVRLNDEDLAKDLVQETFLAALQKQKNFEGKSSERTWLTAIMKNKIFDIYRQKSSGLNTMDLKNAEQEQNDFFDQHDGHWKLKHAPISFGIHENDQLVNKEFMLILKKCMQKLPILWTAVFTMKHIEDQSTDVICAELKVTDSNFWVIIHRTKLNLRACLQKHWL